jgi:hypothetical protein
MFPRRDRFWSALYRSRDIQDRMITIAKAEVYKNVFILFTRLKRKTAKNIEHIIIQPLKETLSM